MIILSHRGYWKEDREKNTEVAFRRSFSLGFGTETDIRDLNGTLVISHDPPKGEEMTFHRFLEIFSEYDNQLPLALNIKSDGLQELIKNELSKFDIQNYFCFDMSVPDGILYPKRNLITFTRQSEYEANPSFYEEADGIWLDEFQYHWITKEIIENHLRNNKKVCIVSPDLHKRPYLEEWKDYKKISDNFMICTDFPEKAHDFFKKNN